MTLQSSRLACVKCQVEMRCKEAGVLVTEMASFGPYKLWWADLWTCPGCGCEIVGKFANRPWFEHYQGDIEAEIARLVATGTKREIKIYERLKHVPVEE